jgi:RecB family exonuclease
MPLNVVCGPFTPSLEDALADRLRALKPGPGRRLAVVTPSRRLSERVQRLLAVEKGMALLNVRFHTFHSLAMETIERAGGLELDLLGDDLFHDKVIDALLKETSPGGPRPRGLSAAYRASVRDLLEAGVDPAQFREHLSDLVSDPGDRAQLQRLVDVQEGYLARLQGLKVMPVAGLERLAAQSLLESGGAALDVYDEVLYYGFYDLNGLQADFFAAVAARRPTTVFFPYRNGHPGYRFAERFFEVKLLVGGAPPKHLPPPSDGLAEGGAVPALFDPAAPVGRAGEDALRVVSVSGTRDEVWKVAKEILALHERARDPVPFDRIGVVARTLEPYRAALGEVFRENAVPFHCPSPEPLRRHPVARLAVSLLTLRRRDFPAAAVTDLLQSPYFRADRFRGASAGADLTARWRLLIERSGVHSGWLQWEGKVAPWAEKGFQLLPELSAEGGEGDTVAGPDVTALWDWLRGLRERLDPNRPREGWKSLVEEARALLTDHLDVPGDGRDRAAWEKTLSVLDSLSLLERLGLPPDWESFLETFEEKVARESLDPPADGWGVRVLNAMDARGESFRVLFLIGLNEGLFPRQVREDPILRDSVRGLLQQPGGYWIQPKSAGYDEERLLFTLLASSVTERLYCLYQRSDDAGRAQAPSIYLRELCRAAGREIDGPGSERVARQPYAKLDDPAFPVGLLSPKELSILLARDGDDPAPLFGPLGLDAESFKGALERVEEFNRHGDPDEFDGLTGRPEGYLRRLARQGLSPTALDAFGACPFRFYASRVLRLKDSEEPAERSELSPLSRGRLYHLVLQTFHAALRETGYWDAPAESRWKAELERAVDSVFARMGWRELGLYPLLWESVRRQMAAHLRRFAAQDLEELHRTGFRPAVLEEMLRGEAPLGLRGTLADLAFHGQPDRIDVRAASSEFRVVDYKTRWPAWKESLADRVLAARAHQPPVYLELVSRTDRPGLSGLRAEGTYFYIVEDSEETTGAPWVQEFPATLWQPLRAALLRQMGSYLRMVENGQFLIVPDESLGGHCQRCAFKTACRKSHPASRRRAESSPWRVEYEALRSPHTGGGASPPLRANGTTEAGAPPPTGAPSSGKGAKPPKSPKRRGEEAP